MNKAVFLDRDGVINRERGDYTYTVEHFEILDGVAQALKLLKQRGYFTIIITNQAGISRGLYTKEDMTDCHNYLNKELPGLIDDIFYCPYHPSITQSLARKPGSLMFERSIARYSVEVKSSWMIGDKDRDLIPAKALGLNTIIVSPGFSHSADHYSEDLFSAVDKIIP